MCLLEYFIPNPFPHIYCLCFCFSWVGSINERVDHSAIYVRWLLGWRYISSLHSADEPTLGTGNRARKTSGTQGKTSPEKDETAVHCCDPALSVLVMLVSFTSFTWYQPCSLPLFVFKEERIWGRGWMLYYICRNGVVKWRLNLIHSSGLSVISYSTTPPISQGLTMSRGQILHFPLRMKDCFVET